MLPRRSTSDSTDYISLRNDTSERWNDRKQQPEREGGEKKEALVYVWLSPLLFCILSHFGRVRLCNPMDYSPPGSSVHGILQARTLEWAAMPFSRGSSPTRD